jgi:hypothetical protein
MQSLTALLFLEGESQMPTLFIGDYRRIRKYAKAIDADGHWRELKYGGRQYRTRKGAVLNWWEKSQKLLFQGHGEAAREFKRRFEARASAKGRLRGDADVQQSSATGKGRQATKKLQQEVAALRNKVGWPSTEIAKLRGRTSHIRR